MRFFALDAQIEFKTIIQNETFENSKEGLYEVSYGFIFYQLQDVDKSKIILDYVDLECNKNGVKYLENNPLHPINKNSILSHFLLIDSTFIFYDGTLNIINCYKKIDSSNFQFIYEVQLKNDILSHLHYYNGFLYCFTGNKKNDIFKITRHSIQNNEILEHIEDPIFKIFSTINGNKNYVFLKDKMIFRDYIKNEFNIINLNIVNPQDTIKYKPGNDSIINNVILYSKRYNIYGNGKDYIKATDLIGTKGFLSNILAFDSLLIVNISSLGYSKREEKFIYLYTINDVNNIKLKNAYNSSYPNENDTLNAPITIKNLPHFFYGNKILFHKNKIICPVSNLNEEHLNGKYKLINLFDIMYKEPKKYSFFIYTIK